jgi:hypothetical protein
MKVTPIGRFVSETMVSKMGSPIMLLSLRYSSIFHWTCKKKNSDKPWLIQGDKNQ